RRIGVDVLAPFDSAMLALDALVSLGEVLAKAVHRAEVRALHSGLAEDVLADVVAVRHAGALLDDEAEQDVGDVVVADAFAGREVRLLVDELWQEVLCLPDRVVRLVPEEILVLLTGLFVGVVADARGMRQAVIDRHVIADPRSCNADVRHDLRVERDRARVHELHDRGGGEDLGNGCDVEPGVDGVRDGEPAVRQPVGGVGNIGVATSDEAGARKVVLGVVAVKDRQDVVFKWHGVAPLAARGGMTASCRIPGVLRADAAWNRVWDARRHWREVATRLIDGVSIAVSPWCASAGPISLWHGSPAGTVMRDAPQPESRKDMHYTLLRNAAAILSYGGTTFLIDPCLDPAGARAPVANTPNQKPNPLVDLPDGWENTVAGVDALIVTHLHMDHFDDTAARVLDQSLPLFGQPEDVGRLAERGFTDLRPVDEEESLGDVRMVRTGGEHGTGDIGRLMAPVSGFVLSAPGEPVPYVA